MIWHLKEYGDEVSKLFISLEKKPKTLARIKRALRELALNGIQMDRRKSKSLGDRLFELKVSHDGDTYRFVYFFNLQDIPIIVTLKKKTQKTPKKFLQLARRRRLEIVKQEIRIGGITIH